MPARAWACAVCGAGQAQDSSSFLLTTALMSGVPILAIVGVGYFIYRRSKIESNDAPK